MKTKQKIISDFTIAIFQEKARDSTFDFEYARSYTSESDEEAIPVGNPLVLMLPKARTVISDVEMIDVVSIYISLF